MLQNRVKAQAIGLMVFTKLSDFPMIGWSYMSQLAIIRPWMVHIYLRPLKYVSFIISVFILIAIVFHTNELNLTDNAGFASNKYFETFDALLRSPLIETFILYCLFRLCSLMNSKILDSGYFFIVLTTFISWISHGISMNAMFPTFMFFMSSVFVVRTVKKSMSFLRHAFYGAFVIHVMYNLPYVVRLYL